MGEIVEVDVDMKAKTDMALMVEDLDGNDVWIPRSQIDSYEGDEDDPVSISIPEWLAEEKGLI